MEVFFDVLVCLYVISCNQTQTCNDLVGGLEHVIFMLGVIIPIDFHIFQRVWKHQPDMDMILLI